ncbi:MAG: EamA family transporter RarD [Thermomicrobiales bacterium]|nr:EamA family transporter RarD [Thermomicrobiales bacterium]
MRQHDETRRGVLFGALAYGSWGVLPIYFHALEPAGPLEILAHRILWSAIFCMIFWAIRGDLGWMKSLWQHPRRLGVVTIAAYVLAVNWGIYIYAVSQDNVLESSLGYFINPIILVLIGVLVLKERMNATQWTAIGLGVLAVIVITIDYGQPPWLALLLAVSFSIYGYIKKMLGVSMGAVETMTAESVLLVPFSLGALWWISAHANNLTYLHHGLRHTLLLTFLGLITILPLTLFGAAARRLPLVITGLLQYITPIGQFLVGVLVFGEHMSRGRWIGFGIVWCALVLLTVDSLRGRRRAMSPT